MKVNIYLETDKQSQECMQRKYGYTDNQRGIRKH